MNISFLLSTFLCNLFIYLIAMWLGELLFPASAVLFVFIISHPVGLFVSVWFKLPVCPFQDEGIKPGGG